MCPDVHGKSWAPMLAVLGSVLVVFGGWFGRWFGSVSRDRFGIGLALILGSDLGFVFSSKFCFISWFHFRSKTGFWKIIFLKRKLYFWLSVNSILEKNRVHFLNQKMAPILGPKSGPKKKNGVHFLVQKMDPISGPLFGPRGAKPCK